MIKVVKGEDVNVKGQALEEEDGCQHAGPLDLRQRLCGHVPLKVLLGVQPVALAVASAPGSPSSLCCLDPVQTHFAFPPLHLSGLPMQFTLQAFWRVLRYRQVSLGESLHTQLSEQLQSGLCAGLHADQYGVNRCTSGRVTTWRWL